MLRFCGYDYDFLLDHKSISILFHRTIVDKLTNVPRLY